MFKEISIKTTNRNQLIDITGLVQAVVKQSKLKEGLCIVYSPHTTAGIIINENADPSVQEDILKTLERLVPFNAGYAHAEGNSDAHVKSSLVGNNQTLIISNGKLQLGSWGGIFFAEFDGPRQRTILVQLVEK